MAWVVHSDWLERMFDGTAALDLDGAGASDIKLGIVTESSIDADTNALYTGLTAVGTGGTSWTGPVSLSGETCGLNGSNNLIFDATDVGELAQDASGFTDGRSLVIYEDTNKYIICHHTEGSIFSLVDGSVTLNFNSSGIWQLTI